MAKLTRSPVVKLAAGYYEIGGLTVARDGRRGWLVSRGNGVSETYRTYAQAVIGARVVLDEATAAELAAFVPAIAYTNTRNI